MLLLSLTGLAQLRGAKGADVAERTSKPFTESLSRALTFAGRKMWPGRAMKRSVNGFEPYPAEAAAGQSVPVTAAHASRKRWNPLRECRDLPLREAGDKQL